MKRLLLILLVLVSKAYGGEDWSSPRLEPITRMYIYPTYAVILQSTVSAGEARCAANNAWSFSWADFDLDTRQRIYSALLAAYTAQKPIMPIFDTTTCGPEGHKRFMGKFSY